MSSFLSNHSPIVFSPALFSCTTAYDILEPDSAKAFDDLPIPACLASDATSMMDTTETLMHSPADEDDHSLSSFSSSQHNRNTSSDDMDMMSFINDAAVAPDEFMTTTQDRETQQEHTSENFPQSEKQEKLSESAEASKQTNTKTTKTRSSKKEKTTTRKRSSSKKASKKKSAKRKVSSPKASPVKTPVASPSKSVSSPPSTGVPLSGPAPTVVLPSGASVKIIGQLTNGFPLKNLQGGSASSASSSAKTNPLKRKRSALKEKEMTPEEIKKAAKRQRNRVLAQQSRERKKKYLENLEKQKEELTQKTEKLQKQMDEMEQEQEQLKGVVLLTTKRRVVLCMLICVALLVVSQQTEDVPNRLATIEMPAELPKDVTKLDMVNEQYKNFRSDLEKELSMALPPSVIKDVVKFKNNDNDGDLDMQRLSELATKFLVHEVSEVLNRSPKAIKSSQFVGVKRRSQQCGLSTVLDPHHCDSEDSDDGDNRIAQ